MTDTSTLPGRRGLYAAAMAVPLFLLVGIGMLNHEASKNHARERAALSDLASLKAQTTLLLTAMVDNEAGQRGYLLSQKPKFLEPYDHALSTLPGLRNTLHAAVATPASRALLTTLEKSMDVRLAFAARTVELQRGGDHAGAVALVATGEGKVLMDHVRTDVAALQRDFDVQTRAAETQFAATLRVNELISWAVVAVDALVVALLIFLLVRLRRAERFLHVCAWSKTVQYHGEWISFETYLMRKFGFSISHGISPQEAAKIRAALGQD